LPEAIVVAPNAQCEGELRDGALSMGDEPHGIQLTGNAPQGVHLTSFSGDPQVIQLRHSL
jgi:hypothetical protein